MLRLLLACGLVLTALASCRSAAGDASEALEGAAGPQLKRFASARAFEAFVEKQRRKAKEKLRTFNVEEEPSVAYDSAPAPPGIEGAAAQASATGAPANPAITNTQTVGVDEGGIVKQVGRYLVMLQDGRLFSADLGDRAGAPLRLADRTDVYRSPATAADWYDEMLVHGDRILVTAYNYRERASEITVFRIDPAGRFTREGRFLLSSDDYYSTENYATRLVGDRLVFYAPFALDPHGGRFEWPKLRRADGDGEADEGEALIGPADVYAPAGEVDWPVIHTVSVCPLKPDMDCRTTAFVGPPMREFYVSPTDAFLWIGAPDGLPWSIEYANQRRKECPGDLYWRSGEGSAAMLYRLPLDGGAIGAVAAEGVPADQFAFDSHGGRFRALLSRPTSGCVDMSARSPLALLDIPLSAFGDRVRRVAPGAYAALPAIEGGQLENRFIGDWLVYGGRTGWSSLPEQPSQAGSSSLFAVPLARPAAAARLALAHNSIRIERAGSDAIVTGYGGGDGLSLSYVSLQGGRPGIAATTILPRRVESEGRSHAFNAWIRPDGSGLIGLPTSLRPERGLRGWSDSESSDLSFVAVSAAKGLAPAGELGLRGREPAGGYECKVSCVDWYGNSRPVFTGGRIFALLGTELVEGRLERGRIAELARLDLTGSLGGGGAGGSGGSR
jgi:hypothetical protein